MNRPTWLRSSDYNSKRHRKGYRNKVNKKHWNYRRKRASGQL